MSLDEARAEVLRQAKAMFQDQRPLDPRSGLGKAVAALYDAEQNVKDRHSAEQAAHKARPFHLVATPGNPRTMCGLKIKDQPNPFPVGWIRWAQERIDNGWQVCHDCDAAALEAGHPLVGNPQ